MSKTKGSPTSYSFPWRYVLLNALLLFVICSSSREMLKLVSHRAISVLIIEAIFAAIGAGFLTLISLGYQTLVYRLMKTRVRRNALWAILFVLPAIMFGSVCIYSSLPTVAARKILGHAELAPLPKSATEIKVYTWSSLFSGEEFLGFRASSRDIEKFLNESPILQNAECEKFSHERMRLRTPDTTPNTDQFDEGEHEFFVPDLNAPTWYKDEIRRGKRYIIHPKWGYYPGEVIVHDEEHLVFVHVIWS
jgi:hypothetical protein